MIEIKGIPGRVYDFLYHFKAHFGCAQGKHFLLFCWLVVMLSVDWSKGTLKGLSRMMPERIRYWALMRMVRSGQWSAQELLDAMGGEVMGWLPPPRDGVLYLIGDPTLKGKRGHQQLHALREIMDEVYRLFDRRCRSETALQKLAKLRRRGYRFKKVGQTLQKLLSPNLEKALTFLNDKLLPSTSNAVERGNRRHRKMQKTVYRVRTKETIRNRIVLDMLREAQAEGRQHTTQTLHLARTGS